ncbi:hypothetical protein IMG5_188780, partial [Ichthyophthirius multifiliis]
ASSNPGICFVHFLFKAFSFLAYFILIIFFESLQVNCFVIVMISIDFWVVKNITGRLLISLRWWSECKQNNQTQWIFECKINKHEISDFNYRFFWIIQLASNVTWIVFLVLNIIGLDIQDALICGFGVLMNGINSYYFYLCDYKRKERLKQLANEFHSDIPFSFMKGSIRLPL